MSAASVREWIAANAPDLPIIEVEGTTATVATAADSLGVVPGRIAKTLAVRAGDLTFLLVARGDAPFAWFLTMARGETECPGLFTQFKRHKQGSSRCGFMRIVGRCGCHGLSPPW